MPPNGSNGKERRKGVDELIKKLDEIQKSHIRCQSRTQATLEFVRTDIKEIKLDQKTITQNVYDLNIKLNSKINGLDKELSVKDQELTDKIKSAAVKKSVVTSGGAAGGIIVIFEFIKFVWTKISGG